MAVLLHCHTQAHATACAALEVGLTCKPSDAQTSTTSACQNLYSVNTLKLYKGAWVACKAQKHVTTFLALPDWQPDALHAAAKRRNM